MHVPSERGVATNDSHAVAFVATAPRLHTRASWQSSSVQHPAPVSSHFGHSPPQSWCVSVPSVAVLPQSSVEGECDGDADGLALGLPEGDADGEDGGDVDGLALGLPVGACVGVLLGLSAAVGSFDGDALGLADGLAEGDMLGDIDGDAEGDEVGFVVAIEG